MTIDVAGVSLDCANAPHLRDFYYALLGGEKLWTDPSAAGLRIPSGLVIVAQHVENYVQPVWPDSSIMHLDLRAGDNLDHDVRFAESCGARRVDAQPDTRWTVLLDPAGHPFCITTMTSD